jgi:hypothetical protein
LLLRLVQVGARRLLEVAPSMTRSVVSLTLHRAATAPTRKAVSSTSPAR